MLGLKQKISAYHWVPLFGEPALNFTFVASIAVQNRSFETLNPETYADIPAETFLNTPLGP